MNTVEDRLREALRERATHSPIDPDAWEQAVARSRRRRWRVGRVRAGFAAPAAAAAAIIAIVIGMTSVIPRSTPGQSGSVPPTQSSSATGGKPCKVVRNVRKMWICFSAIVNVKQGSGHQATVTSFFFGYSVNPQADNVGRSPDFCAISRLQLPPAPNSAGPDGGGSCTKATLNAGDLADSSGSILNIQYGIAARLVTSVTAVLIDGRRVRGVVVSGRGFLNKAWLVTYPKQEAATLLFFDAAGHQVSKLFMPAYDQDFRVPSSGGIALFRAKGGSMVAYLVNGLITFSVANTWEGGFPAAGGPAVTGLLGSGSYWAGSECFGYVHPGVARVVIRLTSGYQTTASAFTPGWPGSGVRFFATGVPQYGPATQGTVTAYDAAGHVMAQEPLIGTGP